MRITYVNGADKVFALHQNVREEEAKDDGHDPGTNKALDGLLRGQLNELGAAKRDTADVGEDVVGDDERGGEKEPDHALEDVVHNEVGLHNDQVQSHMGPCELGELELVVTGVEGGDEEDEAW